MCISVIEIVIQILLVIIGILNVIALIFVALFSNKLLKNENNKNRGNYLLKSLVLDYNLILFYKLLDELTIECSKLKESSKISIKKEVEIKCQIIFTKLRYDFYDIILSVDEDLHRNINVSLDELHGELMKNLFDKGVNLFVEIKFNELILIPILKHKQQIISLLYKYQL